MIESLYTEALLAAAAYAEWDQDETERKAELINKRGFTEAQYNTLFGGGNPLYRVYQGPSIGYVSSSTGFSATVFEEIATGKLTVSYRGTNPGPLDFFQLPGSGLTYDI
jgi:hypothetical protein